MVYWKIGLRIEKVKQAKEKGVDYNMWVVEIGELKETS